MLQKLSIPRPLAQTVASVIDGVWPRGCAMCGDREGLFRLGFAGLDVCGEHDPRVTARAERSPRCLRCAAEVPPGIGFGVDCRECRVRRPAFDRTLAAFDYGGSGIREWVLRFKHGGRRDLAAPLARLLGASVREEATRSEGLPAATVPLPCDWYVPVPLHAVRRLERGYDQAALLAAETALLLRGHCVPLLRRTRATFAQGDPGAPRRRVNVRGAFRADGGRWQRRQALSAQRLWLVDDVMTTGATVDACARALRQVGWRRVGVLALARAERGENREAEAQGFGSRVPSADEP